MLFAAAVIAVSFLIDARGWVVVPLLFVFVVPFEKLFPRHRGQRLRRPGLGTDLAWALASPVMQVVTVVVALGVGLATFAWIPGLAMRPFVALLPGPAQVFLAVVMFDLASYWVHRFSHEVPLFWRFHSVHHSPEHMDWISGLRVHPIDGALLAPPFILLLAAGFDPTLTGALAGVQIVVGIFLHANVRWRLRPLQRLIATPEFHHWHHANSPAAHHTNYSGLLPIWDQIFGTYRVPRELRPERYGVDGFDADSITAQLWWPFRSIERPGAWLRSCLAHPVNACRNGFHVARKAVRGIRRSILRPTR